MDPLERTYDDLRRLSSRVSLNRSSNKPLNVDLLASSVVLTQQRSSRTRGSRSSASSKQTVPTPPRTQRSGNKATGRRDATTTSSRRQHHNKEADSNKFEHSYNGGRSAHKEADAAPVSKFEHSYTGGSGRSKQQKARRHMDKKVCFRDPLLSLEGSGKWYEQRIAERRSRGLSDVFHLVSDDDDDDGNNNDDGDDGVRSRRAGWSRQPGRFDATYDEDAASDPFAASIGGRGGDDMFDETFATTFDETSRNGGLPLFTTQELTISVTPPPVASPLPRNFASAARRASEKTASGRDRESSGGGGGRSKQEKAERHVLRERNSHHARRRASVPVTDHELRSSLTRISVVDAATEAATAAIAAAASSSGSGLRRLLRIYKALERLATSPAPPCRKSDAEDAAAALAAMSILLRRVAERVTALY
jgi:hypothetical protein